MSPESDLNALQDLADRLVSEMRFEEAVELYRKLSEAHPSNESILLSLAWAYRDWGRNEEAIACFKRLLEKEIERRVFTGFAFDELVRLFREKGFHDRLVSLCERVVEAQPEDPAFLSTLGEAYLEAGKTDDGIRVFRTLTEMEPGSSAYFCLLGRAHVQAGSAEEAEECFEKAAAIDPGESHVFLGRLGDLFARAGDLDRAARILRKASAEKPDISFYHCSLGDVLIRQGRLEDGHEAYKRAVACDPGSGEAYLNRLGKALLDGGYGEEAAAVFEFLVERRPSHLFYRQSLEEARKLLKK